MAENYKFSPDAVQKGSSILKILSKSKSHLIYTRNPGWIRFAVIFIARPLDFLTGFVQELIALLLPPLILY